MADYRGAAPAHLRVRRQAGSSFVEYALLCAIIIGGCALALKELEGSISGRLGSIAASLKNPS